MDITHMSKRNKIILYHIMEWITFWWENQSECEWESGDKTQEYCKEFASIWHHGEFHAYDGSDDPGNVAYSAGVYCGEIDEAEACRAYWHRRTSKSLSEVILSDYELFHKQSGLDADDFLPTWFR